LKLDCEGAEYEILLDAKDEVLDRIGVILCEFHPVARYKLEDLVNRLSRSGFRVQVRLVAGAQGIIAAQRN
jgi:hypothetical protein